MTFDCMTDEELTLWREGADTARRLTGSGPSKPCTDCPLAFRVSEYLAGRCCLPAPVIHARTSARRSYNREWMRLYRARSKGATI